MLSSGWTLVDTHPTQGHTFKRPLDVLEVWFLWNGLFDGGTDGIQYCELRLLNGAQDAHMFSEANIVRAWVSTKRRYPLAGATVRSADSSPLQPKETTNANAEDVDNGTGFTSEPHFVVREHDLSVLCPGEIVFGHVESPEEAQRQMTAILGGPRPVSPDLLTKLYVFREAARADVLHVMALVAHCVTDRLAISSFVRCLVDTLARKAGSEPVQMPLEERLTMATPSLEHEPAHLRSLSPVVRRWRRAAGKVIFQLKMARRQGGQTLPCRLTRSTPHTPARSRIVSTSLTPAQTMTVIENCRHLGITFGNAYLALAQVAMTRVLYRRYLRGEISEEEWAYRKRQPNINGGPLNFRPHLDKTWFDDGGAGEFMLSISIFFYELPFMTLGETERQHARVLVDGAPPFRDLLSFDRFLHRAGLIMKQATAFWNHPLFFEIVRAATLEYIEHTRDSALQWMKRINAAAASTDSEDDAVLAVTDFPMVWAFGGSSVGNVDVMSPTEYPLPPTHPLSPYSSSRHPFKAGYVTPPPATSYSARDIETTPRIRVTHSAIHIHARPMELYLSAHSAQGELNMYVLYDGNVYEGGVVEEWLDEVRGAVLWYLGHRQGGAAEGRGVVVRKGGVGARL